MLLYKIIAAFVLIFFLTVPLYAVQVSEEVKQVASETKQAIKKAGTTIKEDVKKGAKETKEAFKKAGQEIKAGSRKAGKEIKEGFEQTGREIKGAVKNDRLTR